MNNHLDVLFQSERNGQINMLSEVDNVSIAEAVSDSEINKDEITIVDQVSETKVKDRFKDLPPWDIDKLSMFHKIPKDDIIKVLKALKYITNLKDAYFSIENFATFKNEKGKVKCAFSEGFAKQISEIKI